MIPFKKLRTLLVVILALMSFYSCENDIEIDAETTSLTPQLTEESTVKFQARQITYIPNELRGNDFNDTNSQWFYGRSRESEHFIVFWDTEYGDNDPNSIAIPQQYRVDIDDLLAKAEQFYTTNVNRLKFAELGSSKLDQYKMMIFLYYQDDWLAVGAGYDNTIGALWLSPNTSKPAGPVVGHEIGHSFQYQVYSDLGNGTGFRYGFGGNGGNGFWEQTAQWQSQQDYPNEIFNYNFNVYKENYHRHAIHENYRYASYFIHYYWTDKHGIDIIGRLWREAAEPEDPFQAYMRLTGISVEQLNDELYEAATKFVTWDLDALRDLGANYIGAHAYTMDAQSDGSYQVAYNRCPGTTGYNVIPLNVPEAGTIIRTQFNGLPNAPGFNAVDAQRAGWRYGYVALLNDNTRVYSTMVKGTTGTASFTIPQDCEKLWLVVTGAPNTYAPHPWDDNEANDDQWPYKVKFTNTNLYGVVDTNQTPKDINLTYNISFPYSSTEYIGTTVSLDADVTKLAQAFVLPLEDIVAGLLGTRVRFYAVQSNGNLNGNTTANGYGHWFNADGDVTNWGSYAKVYSEFAEHSFIFNIGQYPGQCEPGDRYTIKQALVYEYEPNERVQATITFNITIQ